MDILVSRDKNWGKAILTTNSPASHYGMPILQIIAQDIEGDFGPSDLIGDPEHGIPLVTAAQIVAGWASQQGRTPDEISAAKSFLRQWPEGPQISAAAELGRKGGSSKSKAKQKASRENGKKGGWPKGKPRKK